MTPDGGVTYVQMAARTDLPAGTALDHADNDGNPSWAAVSLRQRTHEFVYREDLAARHVGAPLAIPKGLAGSVTRLDNPPIRPLTIAIYAQAAAAGSTPRLLGAFDWAAAANAVVVSGPGGLLASGDTVTVLANGSSRQFVIGLAIAVVGVHV